MNESEHQQTLAFFIALALLIPGSLTYLGDLGTFRTAAPSLPLQILSAPVTGGFLLTQSRVDALVIAFFFWIILLGSTILFLWHQVIRLSIRKAQIIAALKEELSQEKLVNEERRRIRKS